MLKRLNITQRCQQPDFFNFFGYKNNIFDPALFAQSTRDQEINKTSGYPAVSRDRLQLPQPDSQPPPRASLYAIASLAQGKVNPKHPNFYQLCDS